MVQPTPQAYITTPSFALLPDGLPRALPPPVRERTFRAPFGIDPGLFHFALRPEVPVIFATTYVLAVLYLNKYNRRRENKPWRIARSPLFNRFVIVHNAVLALYSAVTFLAMCRAIAHTWPGWNNPNGSAGIADALCKLHGPRGLGDAAAFNSTINIWEVKNAVIKLGYDGNPDPSDVGRLWSEGLAFWGWLFYVSKFYEVLDTLIILAKGKRSATLQTYHHSGAMLCMWAGIRYMSPPIWMFVFVNSFIHALMYTYYTISALGYRVDARLKRSLTSLQIAQFVWGATYAAAHLFVKYDIPITTPYQVAHTIAAAASSVSSAASAASSTASKVIASPAASGTLAALVKKMLLRAVGEEGIAERVTNNAGDWIAAEPIKEAIVHAEERAAQQYFETRYHTDLTKINCIDTSGEAFAIYLNLLYLFPLTFLFGRFFVKAYTSFGKPRNAREAADQVGRSAKVAGKETERKVEASGLEAEDKVGEKGDELEEKSKELRDQLRKDVRSLKDGSFAHDHQLGEKASNLEDQIKSAVNKAKEQGKSLVNSAGEKISQAMEPNDGQKAPAESKNKSPAKNEPGNSKPAPESKNKSAPKNKPESKNKSAPKNEPESKNKSVPKNEPEKPKGAQSKGTPLEGADGSACELPEKDDNKPSDSSQPKKEPKVESSPDQDTTTAESKATREPEGAGDDDDDNKENEAPGDDPEQPASVQDENLAESQATRPGTEDEEPATTATEDDDTDAMGKSGAIVDFAAEKAKDAADEARDAAEE